MSQHHEPAGSDIGAAFLGLIGGAVFIGAILFGIVVLTNRHFEGEKAEAAAKGGEKTSQLSGLVSVHLA